MSMACILPVSLAGGKSKDTTVEVLALQLHKKALMLCILTSFLYHVIYS